MWVTEASGTCIKGEGVDWAYFKHPLPEHVYATYVRYWADVTFN
jgi:hypothetical protein